MFRFIALSPKFPIPQNQNHNHNHKTITLPLAAFFFTHTIIDQPPKREPEHDISITDNTSYWTKKIHRLCAKDRNVDEALRILDRLSLRGYQPDSLNINTIIHALCHSHRFSEAHHRLLLFLSSHWVPDERTCNVLIARLLDSRTPYTTLHVILRLIRVKPEFVPSLPNYNRLMNQFCSLQRRPDEAHRLFFDMKSRGHCPNVVSYTTLINGYCRIGELGNAHKVFDEMGENGVVPNSLTYSVLLGGVLRPKYGSRLVISKQ